MRRIRWDLILKGSISGLILLERLYNEAKRRKVELPNTEGDVPHLPPDFEPRKRR